MPALEGPRERLEADVVGAAVAGEGDDRELVILWKPAAPAQRPVCRLDSAGGRGRVFERDVQPGTFHAVVG